MSARQTTENPAGASRKKKIAQSAGASFFVPKHLLIRILSWIPWKRLSTTAQVSLHWAKISWLSGGGPALPFKRHRLKILSGETSNDVSPVSTKFYRHMWNLGRLTQFGEDAHAMLTSLKALQQPCPSLQLLPRVPVYTRDQLVELGIVSESLMQTIRQSDHVKIYMSEVYEKNGKLHYERALQSFNQIECGTIIGYYLVIECDSKKYCERAIAGYTQFHLVADALCYDLNADSIYSVPQGWQLSSALDDSLTYEWPNGKPSAYLETVYDEEIDEWVETTDQVFDLNDPSNNPYDSWSSATWDWCEQDTSRGRE